MASKAGCSVQPISFFPQSTQSQRDFSADTVEHNKEIPKLNSKSKSFLGSRHFWAAKETPAALPTRKPNKKLNSGNAWVLRSDQESSAPRHRAKRLEKLKTLL